MEERKNERPDIKRWERERQSVCFVACGGERVKEWRRLRMKQRQDRTGQEVKLRKAATYFSGNLMADLMDVSMLSMFTGRPSSGFALFTAFILMLFVHSLFRHRIKIHSSIIDSHFIPFNNRWIDIDTVFWKIGYTYNISFYNTTIILAYCSLSLSFF